MNFTYDFTTTDEQTSSSVAESTNIKLKRIKVETNPEIQKHTLVLMFMCILRGTIKYDEDTQVEL